jgi:DNA end-binding protein Ku
MASVWRGRITFGLVSIPVKLEKAARRERISFRHVRRAQALQTENKVIAFPSGSSSQAPAGIKGRAAEPLHELPEDDALDETVEPVHLQPVSGAAGAPVSRSEILKGYEVSKDQFVVFEPEEIKALRPQTSSALELTEFV